MDRGPRALPTGRGADGSPLCYEAQLARALAVGMPAGWITVDSVYGDDRRLWLEAQPQTYVLAVSGKGYIWLGWQQRQVKTVLAALPEEGWTCRSAGDGAKGPRGYD